MWFTAMKKEEYFLAIESILFVSGKPITIGKLRETFGISADAILEILLDLEKQYENKGINVVLTKKGYTLIPNKKYKRFYSKFIKIKKSTLSKEALEVIAILINSKKVTKGRIDKLRGVNSTRMVNTLLKKGLIKKGINNHTIYYSVTDFFIKNINPEMRGKLFNKSLFKKEE